MPQLREQILHASFGYYAGTFAGGDEANNKLDLELLQRNHLLAAQVSGELGELAMRYDPDLLLPVPNGGNWLVRDISGAHRVPAAFPSKDEETREFSLGPEGAKLCKGALRIVVVDDMFTRLTNTRKAIALVGSENVVAAVGVWDRGEPHKRPQLPEHIATKALIEEYIPPMLPEDSPLWEFTS